MRTLRNISFSFIFISIIYIVIVPGTVSANLDDLDFNFGGEISLQYSGYFGDDDPDNGFVVPDDEFMVRKGALSLEGTYGEHISFGMEVGAEQCPSSSSTNVKILEACLMFRPNEQFRIGLSKAHVLRGYHLSRDCTHLTTAEKVRWSASIAACHPAGVQAGYIMNFRDDSSLELEVSYNNGINSDNVEEEHDVNFGFNYITSIKGLTFAGFYTDVKADFDLDQTMDAGNRMGLGVRYETDTLTLGGEYYLIEGTISPFSDIDPSDMEMSAYYIEAAYKLKIDKAVSYIEPYIRFQSWDRASNVSEDHEYQYMDLGLTFGIDGYNAQIRAEYQTRISEPENVVDEEDKLILRFQLIF